MSERDWRDVADVAELCGVSRTTVYGWAKRAPAGKTMTRQGAAPRRGMMLLDLEWLRETGRLPQDDPTPKRPELSFRTYRESTSTWAEQRDDIDALNARLERERAMRYVDQADTALRLATEALRRAARYEAASLAKRGQPGASAATPGAAPQSPNPAP